FLCDLDLHSFPTRRSSDLIREVASGRYDMTIYSTTYLQDVIETFGLDLVGHPIENEDEIQPPGAYFLYNKNSKSLELRNAIDQADRKSTRLNSSHVSISYD